MELIKHHKTKPFKRKNMMDFAKILRNSEISVDSRNKVVKNLADYLESEDPFFDRKMFVGISTGKYEDDPKTHHHSTVKEKQNDQEI